MANHPEIQKKVFAEIDSVCNGRMVSNDDQAALPYTNAVIKEVMRLYPVVPLMVPYATSKASSVTLNSSTGKTYQIPKGTQVKLLSGPANAGLCLHSGSLCLSPISLCCYL